MWSRRTSNLAALIAVLLLGVSLHAQSSLSLSMAFGNGGGTIAKSTADAANVCLLQSGSDRLAGVLTYVVAPNNP